MGGTAGGRIFLLCLLLTLAWGGTLGREAKTDPETGKVRVIYLGDCIVQENPSLSFIPEPWIDVTRIPASLYWQWAHELYLGEAISKYMRRYMPRTFEDLLANQDVIILSDANVNAFQLHHLDWFKRGVEEGALGLTMVGGDETFGGSGPHPSWGPTSVGEILPVDCIDGLHPKDTMLVVGIQHPEHELMTSLPLSESPFPPFLGIAATTTRQGAEEIAELVPTGPFKGGRVWPFLVEWDRGNGAVFAFTSDWTAASGDLFLKWDYYDDFCINLMLHMAGLPIPQDRELLHRVRGRISEYQMSKIFLYAMVDFIEKFGARTSAVEEKIREAEGEKALADESYMKVELSEAFAHLEMALDRIGEADATAARMKDAALLQVYIIEWLAVTGASLLAGSALYELMVRRKAYRQTATTRFRGDL